MNFLPILAAFEGEVVNPSTVAGVVTQEMLSGVLNEILGLLPTCLPVMITFIGIRKGIAFVRSMLQSA